MTSIGNLFWVNPVCGNILGNAITALTFSNYVLEPFYPECDPPDSAVRLLAAIIISKII